MQVSYNPEMHNRQSIRLKNFDYTQNGVYFITICTQNKEYLFGDAAVGEDRISVSVILNNSGIMIEKILIQTINSYPGISIGKYSIMPNHIHCLISISEPDLRNGITIGEIVRALIKNDRRIYQGYKARRISSV
jgi:REP element-mobilizing transposase RayT